MDLSICKNNNTVICEGQNIYESNDFMRDLYDMMTNTRFRNFVDKYLYEWNSIKTVIMFIKLFETIENEYENKFNKKISKELMLYTINNLFKDRGLRKLVLKSYNDFQIFNQSKYLQLNDI